jgi:uncharacterized protein with PQ loop repeat
MSNKDYIAYIATFIGVLSVVPLTYRLVKDKTTKSISYVWLATSIVGQLLWLYYGFSIKSKPVMIGASLSILCSFLLGWLRFYYDN